MNEEVYFVDNNDIPTGETEEKLAAHHDNTKLHAAFSCYVFNEKGHFLVTQRAHTKKVWHGVWTNSCCGHPAPGEERVEAVKRRLFYELGLTADSLTLVVSKYIYKTPPYNGIIEHEFCPIYVAITKDDPKPNPDEVEAYKWVEWSWYINEIKTDSKDYSVFATHVPRDDQLGTKNIPKWSWWAKDQLSHLENSSEFKSILNAFKTS